MPDRPVCLYDANVLYSAQLRDFLMRLAVGEVVRAHWTEKIHEEWMRNVEADYPDITWEDLQRVRELMDEALPEAKVTGHEGRIEELSLPDSSDRHVLVPRSTSRPITSSRSTEGTFRPRSLRA